MNAMPASLADRLRRAVRPLDDPPQPPGWNAAELADVLGDDACPAAVLVPLVVRDATLSVLFTRRNDGLRHHAGQVSFPGGRIEAGDADAVAAALRETREETGIASRFVQPFGYLDSFATISGFCVAPVVGFVDPGFELAPDPAEVDDVFEVPFDYILAPDRLHRSHIDWRGRPREIVEFAWAGHRIWGATAAILLNLLHRMEVVA